MYHFDFIVVVIFLNFISIILSQNFVKIYEYDYGRFRGVAKNGSLMAFATESSIIFGHLDHSFGFTEFNKTLLTPDLTGITELIEFKFIDGNYIFICNEIGCCLFPIFVVEIEPSIDSTCIALQPYYNKYRLYGAHLRSVNIQKGDKLLFLRAAYEHSDVFIESYSFSGGVVKYGISRDQVLADFQFESIYSFIHGNHIYFIDRVIREDIAMKLLSFTNANNTTRMNTDIVITQICSNDKSSEIRSRMDLILSCEGLWYNDSKAVISNGITSALYLPETGTLLLGRQKSKTMICKFNMTEVEDKFQKTWSFCQRERESSCNKTSYDSFVDEGCLKLEWKEDFDYNFPKRPNFLPCRNTQNKELVSSCDNAIISRSSPPNKQISRYQNYEPVYGKVVFNAPDFDVPAIFPSSKNFNEIFALTFYGQLLKIPLYSSNISTISIFDFGSKTFNKRFLTPWKEKGGFLFIDPFTKKSVYFKNTTCEKDECNETFLSTSSFTCGKCVEASSFTNSCNLEMQSICPPMWYNGKRFKKDIWKYNWIEYDKESAKKIAHCFWTSLANADNCSHSLTAYLKPIFIIPFNLTENVFPENKNSWTFIIIIIVISIVLIILSCYGGIYFYHKNKELSKTKNNSVNTKMNEFNKRYLISAKNVVFHELLGSGFTSDVHLANLTDNSSPIKVAVKTLKSSVKKTDVLKEIKYLSLCKHSNIVSFIGWIDQDLQTCIITEFMAGGDLHAYLIAPSNLLMVSTIFSYTFQILDAMIYLSHHKILHRDLAARNCLLNETFEILKINDFGLSRKMNIDYQYISDATPELPFKWQPLEALFPPFSEYKTFTQKGDIWSFGILIWEMFERGSDLYPGLNLQGLRSFLKSGQRLPCPKHCPRELYKIMLWCWEKNPENRPNFYTIKTDGEVIFNYIKIHQPRILNFPVEVTSVNGYECPRRSKFE